MQNSAPIRERKPSEDGYMLLVAIFLLALLVLSLSAAAPRIAKSIQRDREVETMHRGKQYARAIQLYYRKFHAYPPSVDALVNTDNIRFLRKKYIDPMTGKADWKPIMFGQNKTPLAMGFFGQPLGGLAGQPIAGTGPSGTGGMPGNTGFGSNTGGGIGSSFGSGGSSFGSGGSSFGSGGSASVRARAACLGRRIPARQTPAQPERRTARMGQLEPLEEPMPTAIRLRALDLRARDL